MTEGRLILHLDHQNHAWLGEIGEEQKGVFERVEVLLTLPVTENQARTSRAWSFERASQTAAVHTIWEDLDPNGQIARRVDTGPIAFHCIIHHKVVHLLARA